VYVCECVCGCDVYVLRNVCHGTARWFSDRGKCEAYDFVVRCTSHRLTRNMCRVCSKNKYKHTPFLGYVCVCLAKCVYVVAVDEQ
jgi:hypothetical protein